MAFRTGIDLVENGRIAKAMEGITHSFRDKVFTEKEIEYCESRKAGKMESYAARFAAKEAVAKALGTGFGSRLGWKDVEIINNESGMPMVSLSEKGRQCFAEAGGVGSISVSLSHTANISAASVVLEIKEVKGVGQAE